MDTLINAHVVRDNSLFIVDFKKDLGISFSEGQIAVGYTFSPNNSNPNPNELPICGIAAFNFNSKTRFLLNFANQKTHGTVWNHDHANPLPPNSPGSTGLITDGKVMQDAVMPSPGNMIMEYTKDPNGQVTFKLV